MLARRHHDPTPRIVLGQRLAQAGIPTAMIDLSDGLLSDLGHLLTASKVGARIEQDLLPLSDEFRQALAPEPVLLELALGGGEDYELLFTAPPRRAAELDRLSAELGLALTRIGEIQASPGLVVFDQNGAAVTIRSKGYNHFG
jgi:thiamine-monophosphate kinase